MYTHDILTGFGENVKTTRLKDGEEFLLAIEEIKFENIRDTRLCVGNEVERVLSGTEIEYLIHELAARFPAFVKQKDIEALSDAA